MTKQHEKYINSFSNELRLLINFLGNSLDNKSNKIDLELLNNIDWPSFIELVKFHRVKEQVYQTIQENGINIPDNIKTQLKELSRANRITALKNTAEAINLDKVFKKKNIEALLLKGITLSQQLYGDLGYRHAGDIDFFAMKDDVIYIDKILSDNGYQRTFPSFSLSPKQIKIFMLNNHHYEYFNKEKAVRLEVHWDFFPNKKLYKLDTKKIFNNARSVEISGNKISTLQVKENILYLMVHGSLHGYFRLFWLYDIAKLYCSVSEIDWEETYKEAKINGLERVFEQTFYLINILWEIQIPKFILVEKRNSSINYITNIALNVINSKENIFDGSSSQRLQKNIYQLFLKKGLKYKLSPITRQFTSYHDWNLINIPDKFFFLYYILRPFFIITALLKKGYFKIK
ncbi:MAG: nucleotidyltransferase family protein [Ignavibacteria bacterium]|jgi:hypothetical protein